MGDEGKPHRPPKYVEGHYKPHFSDPDADYVIYVHALDPSEEPHLATTDSSGDAKGVVRDMDGKPIYSGGPSIVGHVRDGEIELREFWTDRVDTSELDIPDKPLF